MMHVITSVCNKVTIPNPAIVRLRIGTPVQDANGVVTPEYIHVEYLYMADAVKSAMNYLAYYGRGHVVELQAIRAEDYYRLAAEVNTPENGYHDGGIAAALKVMCGKIVYLSTLSISKDEPQNILERLTYTVGKEFPGELFRRLYEGNEVDMTVPFLGSHTFIHSTSYLN